VPHIFKVRTKFECKLSSESFNYLVKGAISELLLVLNEARCTAIYCALFKNIFYQFGTGIRLLLPQIIPLQYQCSYQYYIVVISFFAKYCQKLKELSENRIFFVNSVLRIEWLQSNRKLYFWGGYCHIYLYWLTFLGEVLPNFDLKNMISTYTKDFPYKKWPKFTRFWKKEFPDHHNKFE
jgi:hypothetical protein